MKIILDRNGETPLYLQIVKQIQTQIMTGALPAGYRLLPERTLAESLAVNRTTVLNAYRELKAEGLVVSHVGRGTIVADLTAETTKPQQLPAEPIWNHYFNEYSDRFANHSMNDLLNLASRRDIISFATGIAAPENGNSEILEIIRDQLSARNNDASLLHSPVEGFLSLRQALSNHMVKRGCSCTPEEIMVVAGSQQGIDLAGRVLIDPGDIVLVEEPTFFPALRVFRGAGARVIGIPMAEDGMDMEALAQLLKRYHPKFIYTMPSFHNPTGIEMSVKKRQQLLNLAYQYQVLIIEDDAYGELCYSSVPLPTLKSMDQAGYVIYLNTFSKIIYPGLRIGWLAAKKTLIKRFSAVRQISDLHTNCLSQQIVEEFISGPGYDLHLQKICQDYRTKRDLMAGALKNRMLPGMTFHCPAGGYYIWCRLPEGVSAVRLLEKAGRQGVSFIPGDTFKVDESQDQYMRLNFTFAAKEDIKKGIELIYKSIRELTGEMESREAVKPVDITPIV